MAVTVYLDETGDHGLEKHDANYPAFAVVLLACERDYYCDHIVPGFIRLKQDFCGHEGIILHSRDIRKWQKGFEFLADPETREEFYKRLNALMERLSYTLFCGLIKKQEHRAQYGRWANDPYDLALTFVMERLLPYLEDIEQQSVTVIAERCFPKKT